MPKEMNLNQKKEDLPNEIICVIRYKKQQFIKKGMQATPVTSEFRWNGNRVPMPRGNSCGLIQMMLKTSR